MEDAVPRIAYAILAVCILASGCLQPTPGSNATTSAPAGLPKSAGASSFDTAPAQSSTSAPSTTAASQPPSFSSVDVEVLQVSGFVTESGPAYTFSSGCGQPPPLLVFDPSGQSVWFSNFRPVPMDSTVFVARNDRVRWLSDPCGTEAWPEGVRGSGNVTLWLTPNHTESIHVERVGDSLVVAGTTLAPGENVTWQIHWSEDRRPTPGDTHNGTYSYDGALRLNYLWLWPAGAFHRCPAQAVVACR